MTPDRSHCEGCFRTLDEIRAWSKASGAERRVIWAALLRRAGVTPPEELA
ncbi:predicted Fe-S protein [Acidovorax sp. MR-S7]|nr:predicted Fe-S protein [Acidovorax sp. MR-S7]